MKSKTVLLAVVAIFLSLLPIGSTFIPSSAIDTSPTQNCSAGFFTTSVSETTGTLAIICNQVGWTQLTGFPSACPANQFVIAVGATLTCATPSGGSDTATTAKCTSGQFVNNVTESGAGVMTVICSLVNWSSLQNFPTGCTAGNFVTNVGLTLTCASPNQEQVSTQQCTNSGYHVYNVTEASSGVITIVCAQQTWSSIISFPTGCSAGSFVTKVNVTLTCVAVNQETNSTQQCTNNTYHVYNVTESLAGAFTILCAQQTWASLQSFPSACSSGQYVSAVGVTLTCSAVGWTQLTGFPSACAAGQYVSTIASTPTCTNDNINFQSNNKNCTDVTATTKKMAGFKLNYTTVGTGKVYVTINFQITAGTAALVNTKYQPAYGTGSAPACNAAVTGTVVGNQYEVSPASSTAAAIWSESVTIGITTLSASTTYWFDIQISDSTTGSWIYGLPQMTVTES